MADPKVWMPFFVADYLADTGHLGTIEHGAYLLLILHYWRTAKPLPSDEGQLRKIARMTPAEWADGRGVLLDFFDLDGGVYRHTRIDQELRDASTRIDAKSRGGKAAAAKRWQNDAAANASATAEQKQSDAPSPSPSPSPSPVPTQAPSQEVVRAEARREPKGARWPSEAVVVVDWYEDARKARERNNLPPADLALEAEKFANHWASSTHRNAVKSDWKKAWVNWVLGSDGAKNGRGRTALEQGRGIRGAAEHALAAIKRNAGEKPTGGNHPSAEQRQALTNDKASGENRPGDTGADHRGAGDVGCDLSIPHLVGRGTEPEIPNFLRRPRAISN